MSDQTTGSSEDARLLARIAAGDEASLAAFYDRHGGLVYGLALSIVRDERDAEEVTQEAFYRVWTAAGQFEEKRGSVLAWLTTIARRLAIDRTRSKLHRARSREIEPNPSSPELGVGERDVTSRVAGREVREALSRLNERQQEVIRLSYFEGLSHAKIAAHLDTPVGTVKSRIRDAVIQLRKELADGRGNQA